MGVAEIHGAEAEFGAWRLQVAEKEDDVASTADPAGEHDERGGTASTMGSEVDRAYSTASSRLADLERSFPDLVESAPTLLAAKREARRQRIADVMHSVSEPTADSAKPASVMDSDKRSCTTPASPLFDLESFASVSGFPDLERSATTDAGRGGEARRRRVAERRARLRERYGKTPSEHALGFCSSDCTACRSAAVSPGETAAAPATGVDSRPAASEVDVTHSTTASTAGSARLASVSGFPGFDRSATAASDRQRSRAAPAAPWFDLERLASAVYV